MKRRQYSPDEKSRLVLEVLKGERTINEIAVENNVHPNVLARWKREAIEGLPSIFEDNSSQKRKEQKAHEQEIQELYAQIGKLTTQNEWLKKIWFLIFPVLNDGRSWIWMIQYCRFLFRQGFLGLIGRVCITNPFQSLTMILLLSNALIGSTQIIQS